MCYFLALRTWQLLERNMNRKKIAVLAGLAIALLCISSCKSKPATMFGKGPGAGHHYGQQDPRVFEVYIYADPQDSSKCLLDWPVGTIWQGRHQTVEWFSDDGGAYTVDFGSNSPFTDTKFNVPSNGKVSSKALKPGASGYYTFAVFSGGSQPCKDASDPGYHVKP
jgi:hypothetical protein